MPSRHGLTQSAWYAPETLKVDLTPPPPTRLSAIAMPNTGAHEISCEIAELKGTYAAGVSGCLRLFEVLVEISTESRQNRHLYVRTDY